MTTKRAFAISTKRGLAGLAAAVAIFAAIASSTPAQASPAAATAASDETASAAPAQEATQTIEPRIHEEPCDSTVLPRQIWLTSGDDCRGFGGTIGGLNLGNYHVDWISPGDYTGTIVCNDGPIDFEPGVDLLLNKPCTSLEIRPGS